MSAQSYAIFLGFDPCNDNFYSSDIEGSGMDSYNMQFSL